MSYHHLTTFERGRIEALLSEGYSHRSIAKKLHRHHSCIDHEVRRNTPSKVYNCEQAQKRYMEKRQNSKPKGKSTTSLLKTISACLSATWSPEQIAYTKTAVIVCFKTIYRWLYAGMLPAVNTSCRCEYSRKFWALGA